MNKVVTVRIQGGLGNQMFGWAAGFSLAKANKASLILDLTLMKKGQFALNEFLLDKFGTTYSKVNSPRLHRYPPFRKNFDFFEKDFKFDARFNSLEPNVRLNGYFQSWKYFENYDAEIRFQLNTLSEPSKEFSGWIDYFGTRDFLAIHIRRGDYMNLTSFHGLTTREYYERAIKLIKSLHNNLEIVVFSDDIGLAKQIIEKDAIYIGPSDLKSPNENILLMSRAYSIIGSNSSFSWWAAWLNDKEDSLNIFPRPWFTENKINTIDLLKPSWITLGI